MADGHRWVTKVTGVNRPTLSGFTKAVKCPRLSGFTKVVNCSSLSGFTKVVNCPWLSGFTKTVNCPRSVLFHHSVMMRIDRALNAE